MDANTLLLVQAAVVLGMMVLLAILKHRTRRSKLDSYTRRMSRRGRYRRVAPAPVPSEEPAPTEPSEPADEP